MDGRRLSFAPVAGGIKSTHDVTRSDLENLHAHYAFYRGSHGRLSGLYAVAEDEGMELRLLVSPSRANLVSVVLPLEEDAYPSLSFNHPETSWFERALAEREGLVPEGHPDLRPLRLRSNDGGWVRPMPGRRDDYFLPCQADGHMQIPVGPVHAGVIGSGHFRFHVQGENVEALQTMLGYCHRGVEDLLSSVDGREALSIVERISGDSGVAHTLAYCQALEGDLEIPLRARCIRAILSELERMACHLGSMGGIVMDVAYAVPAQRLFGLKEEVHRLMQKICGHRYGWNSIVPGGVKKDLRHRGTSLLEMLVISLGLEIDSIMRVLNNTASFVDRAETTGIVEKSTAEALMLVGPVARASGVPYDVRENMPYSIYSEVGMRIPYMRGGDVLARLEQRAEELKESSSIILQALELMPEGDIKIDMRSPLEHDGVGMVESPRGELVHALHIRRGRVRRHMVKDPSFHNWRALELAALGNIVPDFPVINKSFDLSYSGMDL